MKNSTLTSCDKPTNCLVKDHYNKLVMIARIRRDIRHGVDASIIQQGIMKEFRTLNLYLEDEEKSLLAKMESTDPLRIVAENQHTLLRLLVQRFRFEHMIELVEEFADVLEEHIRFEERSLHPHINKVSSGLEMKHTDKINKMQDDNCIVSNS